MSRNKKLMREYFAVETEYTIKDIEYEIVDEPYLGYKVHLCKLSAGWRPLFQRHKTISTFKEVEKFCLKNKSMVSIYDEYGRRYTWKQYFKKVYNHSQRKAEPRKWIYDIDPIFQIMVLDYIWHHVQSRKRKYICHSVIENTTRMKNWRRNVFMCMKEYGVMRRVGKIQIIHSIGQRVNFAKGVDNICMNILI